MNTFVEYSNDIGKQPYDTSFSFMIYDADSVHLITRHRHQIEPKGYLMPLSPSSWLMFVIFALFIVITIQLGTHFMLKNVYWDDIAPWLCMFYHGESSGLNSIYRLKIGKCLIISCMLINSFFINTYNQNIRSSTIEPFYESLPNNLNEVDDKNSLVFFAESFNVYSAVREGSSLRT